MSETDRVMAKGRAVEQYTEAKSHLADLEVEAARLADAAQRTADPLRKPHALESVKVTAPDPQKVASVLEELRESRAQLESLRKTLVEFGLGGL